MSIDTSDNRKDLSVLKSDSSL